MVLIFMNYYRYCFKKDLDPNPQSFRFFLGVKETLLVQKFVVLSQVTLKENIRERISDAYLLLKVQSLHDDVFLLFETDDCIFLTVLG